MDSHLQCAQVDHNLRTHGLGKLGRNVPNACKRCIGFGGTNVKGVQEPSCDSGDSGRPGSSLSSDLYCGNENTGCLGLQEVSGTHWVGFVWEQR